MVAEKFGAIPESWCPIFRVPEAMTVLEPAYYGWNKIQPFRYFWFDQDKVLIMKIKINQFLLFVSLVFFEDPVL